MEKKTITIEANSLGEAREILPIEGYLEKITVVYDNEPKTEDTTTEIKFLSSEEETILQLNGNKNQSYYPRAFESNKAGAVCTFDGNNPVPTRFYIDQYIVIQLKANPGKKIENITLFYEPDKKEETLEEVF